MHNNYIHQVNRQTRMFPLSIWDYFEKAFNERLKYLFKIEDMVGTKDTYVVQGIDSIGPDLRHPYSAQGIFEVIFQVIHFVKDSSPINHSNQEGGGE